MDEQRPPDDPPDPKAAPRQTSGLPGQRSTPEPALESDAKRKRKRERKRRLAARKAAGLACCGPVEFDRVMLQYLLATRWLVNEADAFDPVKIGEAVSEMWRESAYGK